MENKKYYELTEEGLKALEAEKAHLIDVERPRNIQALQDARSQGDLSENADYDAARDEQTRIESRIAQINEILKNVKIIQNVAGSKVTTGKKVTISYLEKNMTKIYEIVGTIEANPFENKISNESPLGAAIAGHDIGDIVTVVTAKGSEFKVKILDVK